MTDIVALIMIFGIPLSGIWSYTYLQAKKLKIQEQSGGITNEDRQLIAKLLQENRELKNRIENIEVIVTDGPVGLNKAPMRENSQLKKELNSYYS